MAQQELKGFLKATIWSKCTLDVHFKSPQGSRYTINVNTPSVLNEVPAKGTLTSENGIIGNVELSIDIEMYKDSVASIFRKDT